MPGQKVQCRCKRCKHRKTFNRHPEHYERRWRWLVRCANCGYTGKQPGDLPWFVDKYRSSGREHRRVMCRCDKAYWFPHRRGSKFCMHSTRELTEADEREYEDMVMNFHRKAMGC